MVLRTVRFTLLAVLCAAFLAAVAAVPAAASGHWQRQSPLPEGGGLCDVSFVGDEGWAVTGDNAILHTTDGGATWTSLPADEEDMLYAVRFVSHTEGWAAGDWGVVLHTTDGGMTWERQVSTTLDTLFEIEFVDATHGWIVGYDSVLATTDGGATWQMRLGTGSLTDWYWYGPESWLSGLAFSDTQHGCVVGAHSVDRQEDDYVGTAWSTTDGGVNWVRTDVTGTTDLSDVTIQDGVFWAAGAENAVAHSADGVHWTRDTLAAPVYLSGIAMTAGGAGWAVGSGDSDDYWYSDSSGTSAIVLRTADGGASWDPVVLPVVEGDPPMSVDFDGALDGRMLGESGTLYVTHDAGANWGVVGPALEPMVTFQDLTRAPDGLLWAVGTVGRSSDDYYGDNSGAGAVWRSADDGATWQKLDDPLFEAGGLSLVHAVGGGEAWVAGANGRILHTDDAGTTWTQQATGTGTSLTGLVFTDADHGWAVSPGMRGTVLKTTDGGDHWKLTVVGTRERYFTVLASGGDLWLGGMAYRSDCEEEGPGLVAHSADGGGTWTTMPAGKRAILDLCFPGGGQGWAVTGIPYYDYSGRGRLMHTADGGATWTDVKVGTSGSFYGFSDVVFADAQEGWMLADSDDYDGALVLHTVDGGAHWGAVRVQGVWDLRTLSFSGHDDGWVAGRGSAILATTDGGGIAPISACNVGSGPKWVGKDFKVKVKTQDDGLGLAPTQTRLDDGPWQDVATRTIKAPRNHTNDGYHVVRYRGVDVAGNREAVRGSLIVVDTRPPKLVAGHSARARAGRTATVRIKADDALSPLVRVFIHVYKQDGTHVRQTRTTAPADGKWHAVRYAAVFPVGKYRMVVEVKDLAGNRCVRSRTLTLTVRK